MLRATKSTEKDKEETFSLTLPQHAHSQTLHEAAGLARLASPLGDLALVGRRTAVLDVACNTWKKVGGSQTDRRQGLSLRGRTTRGQQDCWSAFPAAQNRMKLRMTSVFFNFRSCFTLQTRDKVPKACENVKLDVYKRA